MPNLKASFLPSLFEKTNEEDARGVILSPERGTSTDERWIKETPFVAADIGAFLSPGPESLLLDYGCGLGRLARELIAAHGCRVLGVDITLSMRRMAPGYVNDDRFSVVSKQVLLALAGSGLKVDGCYSTWVLQHCLDPEQDVALIKSVLKPDGLFYVLNNIRAAVPSDRGWVDNGVDIIPILDREFGVLDVSQLPLDCTTADIARLSFIAKLKNGPVPE